MAQKAGMKLSDIENKVRVPGHQGPHPEAYVVYGHFNDLYFFEDRTDVRRCPVCRHLLSKWEEDLTVVPIGKFRKLDVASSYDGVNMFSRRAKSVYEQAGMSGLQFTRLSHPDLFAVQATDIVRYDPTCRGARFIDKCDICGQFRFVGVGTPHVLMRGSTVPRLGFARTDLEFAEKDEKSPLLICGDEAAKILRAAKLKGLDLEKVETDDVASRD